MHFERSECIFRGLLDVREKQLKDVPCLDKLCRVGRSSKQIMGRTTPKHGLSFRQLRLGKGDEDSGVGA